MGEGVVTFSGHAALAGIPTIRLLDLLVSRLWEMTRAQVRVTPGLLMLTRRLLVLPRTGLVLTPTPFQWALIGFRMAGSLLRFTRTCLERSLLELGRSTSSFDFTRTPLR